MQPAAPRKSRPWLIAAPLALFLMLAVAWTIGWFVIKREVERGFDAWLAAEASAGRSHACPDRSVRGFPFRIDISCQKPTFQLQTPEGPVQARVEGMTATALIYRPEHVVVDLRAPLVLEQNGAELAAVEFQRGQASYRAAQTVFERFSLVLDRVTAKRGASGRPDVTLEQLEVHTRLSPSAQPTVRDYDMAVTARRIAPPGVRPEQGADVSTNGTLRGWPIVRTTQDGPIAEWARRGGTFELQDLRISRGTGLLAASGRLGFNSNGRADGLFRAGVADSAALLSGLAIPGVGDPGVLLGPILALVGRPGEIEGRRGTEVQVRVQNGALSLGAVQVMTFPPVF